MSLVRLSFRSGAESRVTWVPTPAGPDSPPTQPVRHGASTYLSELRDTDPGACAAARVVLS